MNPSRPSRSRSPWINAVKTLGQSLVFYAVFLVVIPWGLLWLADMLPWTLQCPLPANRVVGVAVLVGCTAIGLYSGILMAVVGQGTPIPFDSTNRLVVRGIYRYVRNPMVLAGLGQGLGVAVYFESVVLFGYVILGGILWHFIARPWEERDLLERFGADYEQYHAAVRCWVPRLRPYRPRGRLENQRSDARA